jgi:ABC-type dipeptide/oligopeptide/nickel transport system ATPase component
LKLYGFLPAPYPSPAKGHEQEEVKVYRPTQETIEASARPRNDLSIRLGQHSAIVGATDSGKTYFTLKGLLEYMRVRYPHAKRYILDSTEDTKMEAYVPNHKIVEGDKAPDLLRDPTYTLIWRPRHSKNPSEYARWFNRLNDAREPQIIVIDEVASITDEAENELEPLLKQLRKHGGTVIVETQSIAKVDPDVFRQMSHFFQFFINAEVYDLARARSYLGITREEQRPPLSQYGFFYRPTRGNFPMREYRDMRQFFGGTI